MMKIDDFNPYFILYSIRGFNVNFADNVLTYKGRKFGWFYVKNSILHFRLELAYYMHLVSNKLAGRDIVICIKTKEDIIGLFETIMIHDNY